MEEIELNPMLEMKLQELGAFADTQAVEWIFILDDNGVEYARLTDNEHASVSLTMETVPMVMDRIHVHNHPVTSTEEQAALDALGNGISPNDLLSYFTCNIALGVIFEPGCMHLIQRPRKGWPKVEAFDVWLAKQADAVIAGIVIDVALRNGADLSAYAEGENGTVRIHQKDAAIAIIRALGGAYECRPRT